MNFQFGSWLIWSVLRRHLLILVHSPLGTLLQTCCCRSWKGETYGFVYTKHYFSWFLGVGFGNVGSLFPSGFPKWIRGCHFAISYKI